MQTIIVERVYHMKKLLLIFAISTPLVASAITISVVVIREQNDTSDIDQSRAKRQLEEAKASSLDYINNGISYPKQNNWEYVSINFAPIISAKNNAIKLVNDAKTKSVVIAIAESSSKGTGIKTILKAINIYKQHQAKLEDVKTIAKHFVDKIKIPKRNDALHKSNLFDLITSAIMDVKKLITSAADIEHIKEIVYVTGVGTGMDKINDSISAYNSSTGQNVIDAQKSLDNEQKRVNLLKSANAKAIKTNVIHSSKSNFDSDAQTKYGINIAGAASGQVFVYKYIATATTISITPILVAYGSLTPTIQPAPITLSPTPIQNFDASILTALTAEQKRINGLKSAGATAAIHAAHASKSNFDSDAQTKYGINVAGSAPGYSFTYKYIATTTTVTITVMINGDDSLISSQTPTPITLTPTPAANIFLNTEIAQKALNVEQARINLLISSKATATIANVVQQPGTNFDSKAQTKYGIKLGVAAPGQKFTYTYGTSFTPPTSTAAPIAPVHSAPATITTTGTITITAVATGYASLTSTPLPTPITLSPTPTKNTLLTKIDEALNALYIEQERINGLKSVGATVVPSDVQSTLTDFDSDAQTKYGINVAGSAPGHSFTYKYVSTSSSITVKAIVIAYPNLTSIPAAKKILLHSVASTVADKLIDAQVKLNIKPTVKPGSLLKTASTITSADLFLAHITGITIAIKSVKQSTKTKDGTTVTVTIIVSSSVKWAIPQTYTVEVNGFVSTAKIAIDKIDKHATFVSVGDKIMLAFDGLITTYTYDGAKWSDGTNSFADIVALKIAITSIVNKKTLSTGDSITIMIFGKINKYFLI